MNRQLKVNARAMSAAATVLALLVLALALLVKAEPSSSAELQVLSAFNSYHGPGASPLGWVSMITGTEAKLVLIPVAAAGLWLTNRRRAVYAVLAASIVVGVAAALGDYALGEFVGRTRPVPASYYSFPSAHTYGTTLYFGFVAFLMLRHRLDSRLAAPLIGALMLLVGAVGPSRMYLNMHWPADVAAGYMIGLIGLVAVIALYLKLERGPQIGHRDAATFVRPDQSVRYG